MRPSGAALRISKVVVVAHEPEREECRPDNSYLVATLEVHVAPSAGGRLSTRPRFG
jgi:hypothetical protein